MWSSWRVTYRDVVVLDDANRFVGSLNLTDYDLEEADNRQLLRDLLAEAGAQ